LRRRRSQGRHVRGDRYGHEGLASSRRSAGRQRVLDGGRVRGRAADGPPRGRLSAGGRA